MNEMNEVNTMNEINEMNTMNEINEMNTMNEINEMNTMNEINEMNTMNEINEMNTMNEINENSINDKCEKISKEKGNKIKMKRTIKRYQKVKKIVSKYDNEHLVITHKYVIWDDCHFITTTILNNDNLRTIDEINEYNKHMQKYIRAMIRYCEHFNLRYEKNDKNFEKNNSIYNIKKNYINITIT